MPVVNYIWDVVTDNVIMEVDDEGNTLARYVQQPSLYGEVTSQDRDGQTRYFNFDGLGNTAELTDENENITDTYEYSAFGEEIAHTGSTVNPFRYKGALGYYTNSETNDIYVRERIYESSIGRWLSVDPLGVGDSINQYIYVLNGPVLLIDPSGLFGCECCCCPEKLSLSKLTIRTALNNGFWEAQFIFRVIAAIFMKPANIGEGKGCKFEWYECPDKRGSLGQQPGKWFKGHTAGPAKSDWYDYYDGDVTVECPGSRVTRYWEDSPNVELTKDATINIKFAVRVRSEPECCNDITKFFSLHLTVVKAVGDIATFDPQPPVIREGLDDKKRPTQCTEMNVPFDS